MNILITGGSGTLGSQLVKDLTQQGHCPVVYSRDPARQMHLNTPKFIGDVRDVKSLCHAFKKHDIDCVIHAACNKHIQSCEEHPRESIDINVNGSIAVCDAIWTHNQKNKPIAQLLAISTDKACSPSSVYGMSKFMMEKLVIEFASRFDGTVNAIRLGNIFGSNGSVLQVWRRLSQSGDSICLRTINGQDMFRFAMSPQSASKFCIEALRSSESRMIFCPKVKVVNISQLAAVFADRYNLKIVKEEAWEYEKVDEQFINNVESKRTKDEGNFFCITPDFLNPEANWELSTSNSEQMKSIEIEKFLDETFECVHL